METLTIDLLTDAEKHRARKILELIRKIKTRKWDAFVLSLISALLLFAALIGADIILLKHNIFLLRAIGLPLNSGADILVFFLVGLSFAYGISFPLYAVIFLPRARLRVLKLKELAWQGDQGDVLFQKLAKIRALTNTISLGEIDALSSAPDKKALDQFLANAIRKIKIDI